MDGGQLVQAHHVVGDDDLGRSIEQASAGAFDGVLGVVEPVPEFLVVALSGRWSGRWSGRSSSCSSADMAACVWSSLTFGTLPADN